MDLRTLQSALARLAEDRAADPLQTPKNVAFALGADAGLLLSLFRGLAERQGLDDPVAREAAADALTSILVNVAQLANHVGLDTSAALRARIKGKPAPALAAPGAPAVTLPPSAAKAAEPPAAAVAAPAPPSGPAAEPSPPAVSSTPAVPSPAAEKSAARSEEPAPAPAKGAGRKRGGAEVIAVRIAPTPAAPQRPAASAVEVIVVEEDEEAVSEAPADVLMALPAAPAAAALAPSGPVSLPPDASEHIDAEEVLELAKALARQLDRSTRDDPVLRELRDELETLRRSLYAANTKKAWIAGSLRSVRAHLEEALSHSFAEEVRAAEFIGHIEKLLAAP